MSSEGTPANQGQQGVPNLQVVAQYIKDLSFENPGATSNLTDRPQIELAVDLNIARLPDPDMFEVELKIRVDAKGNGNQLFLLEVIYAGVFRLTNVPDVGTQQMILLIQAPHMLFPLCAPRGCRCGARWRHAALDDRADRLHGAVSGAGGAGASPAAPRQRVVLSFPRKRESIAPITQCGKMDPRFRGDDRFS